MDFEWKISDIPRASNEVDRIGVGSMCRYSKPWLSLEQAWVLSYRRAKFQPQLIHHWMCEGWWSYLNLFEHEFPVWKGGIATWRAIVGTPGHLDCAAEWAHSGLIQPQCKSVWQSVQENHILILRAVLSKKIMHLKYLAYAKNSIHIHFFTLSSPS